MKYLVCARLFLDAEDREEALKKATFMIGEYPELDQVWIDEEFGDW